LLSRMVDVGVDAPPQAFVAAVQAAAGAADVDSIVAVFVPPLQRTAPDRYALGLRTAAGEARKPVLSTFLGFDGVPGALAEPGPSAPNPGSVPSYPTPERAVRALARAVRYAQWRRRPPSEVPQLRVDRARARELVEAALATGAGLDPSGTGTAGLLDCYGIELSTARPPGVEVVLGVHDDRSFGALVSFGVGGVATELLGDRAYAIVPLTTAAADELIRAPRAAPMLRGYGGIEPADLDALADVALRLSALADDLPEVGECSLAAVATPSGVVVRSAQIQIGDPAARLDSGPRRLRGL
jgi:acyl-CoA synthetase (NDP forming)